jgi:acetoin utilization deacetylase AcuC-like enzyme
MDLTDEHEDFGVFIHLPIVWGIFHLSYERRACISMASRKHVGVRHSFSESSSGEETASDEEVVSNFIEASQDMEDFYSPPNPTVVSNLQQQSSPGNSVILSSSSSLPGSATPSAVVVEYGEGELGVTIEEPEDEKGAVITTVKRGGPLDGKVQIGMRLLTVGDIDVSDMQMKDINHLIRGHPVPVKLSFITPVKIGKNQLEKRVMEIIEDAKIQQFQSGPFAMEGMFSVKRDSGKGDFIGQWYNSVHETNKSTFKYDTKNWAMEDLPCHICKRVDTEKGFFCDMCDESFHFSCINWKDGQEPAKWYCGENGNNCRRIVEKWGDMPASIIFSGKFSIGAGAQKSENIVMKFKYLQNQRPPADDEPCITAEAFGFGKNEFGHFIVTGKLEVYNNFTSPGLDGFRCFHRSDGNEKFFFKISVYKHYLDPVKHLELQDFVLYSLGFANFKALINTPLPQVGNSNKSHIKVILDLEKTVAKQIAALEKSALKLKKEKERSKEKMAKTSSNVVAQSAESSSENLPHLSKKRKLNVPEESGEVPSVETRTGIWHRDRRKTLIVTDVDCYWHSTPRGHCENKSRVISLWSLVHENFGFRVSWCSNVERVNLQTLLFAHNISYIRSLFDADLDHGKHNYKDIGVARCGEGQSVGQSTRDVRDDDTYLSATYLGNSVNASLKSAGAVVHAIDAVLDGKYENAFCIIRPPGHHAGRCGVPKGAFCGAQKKSQGFCILNNVAIGAFHAVLKRPGNLKVAIVDIDLHAGNGTQEILASFLRKHQEFEGNFMFASIHQADIFPHLEIEKSSKNSFRCINMGLTGQVDSHVWRKNVVAGILPCLRDFSPDLVLLSAGFDAHHAEMKIANKTFALQDEDYDWIVRQASEICSKIVSCLEGGYAEAALHPAVFKHIEALVEV